MVTPTSVYKYFIEQEGISLIATVDNKGCEWCYRLCKSKVWRYQMIESSCRPSFQMPLLLSIQSIQMPIILFKYLAGCGVLSNWAPPPETIPYRDVDSLVPLPPWLNTSKGWKSYYGQGRPGNSKDHWAYWLQELLAFRCRPNNDFWRNGLVSIEASSTANALDVYLSNQPLNYLIGFDDEEAQAEITGNQCKWRTKEVVQNLWWSHDYRFG